MFRRNQTKGSIVSLSISLPNHEPKGKPSAIQQSKDKKRFKTSSIKHWSSSLNPIHRDPSNTPSSSAYIIESDFQENILTISVYHTITTKTWRQQFTQNSFKSNTIDKIAKTLIQCIQSTANHSDPKPTNDNAPNADNDEKETNPSNASQIKIFEHNEFCYVTLLDSDLPSFALRPAPIGTYVPHIRQFKPRKLPMITAPSNHNIKWNGNNTTPSKQKQCQSDSYFDLSPSAGVHSIEGMSSENTMSTWAQSLTEYHEMDKAQPGNNDNGYNKYKAMTKKNSIQYGFV